jgi:hypothetical protein
VRNQSAAPVSIGYAVPGLVDARATVDRGNPFISTFYQKFIGAGSRFNYLVRSTAAGTYQVRVNIGNGNGQSQPLQVYLNNSLVKQVNAPATTEGIFKDTAPVSLSLNQGLNVLRLVVPTERPYDLNYLKVTPTSGTITPASLPNASFYSFAESILPGQPYTQTFKVSDAVTPANQIAVTATSDNPILLPNSSIAIQSGSFDNGANNRRLSFTPAAGKTGTVNITLTLTNGQGVERQLA